MPTDKALEQLNRLDSQIRNSGPGMLSMYRAGVLQSQLDACIDLLCALGLSPVYDVDARQFVDIVSR